MMLIMHLHVFTYRHLVTRSNAFHIFHHVTNGKECDWCCWSWSIVGGVVVGGMDRGGLRTMFPGSFE